MGKQFLTLGDVEIENKKSYHHESPILLKDVKIERVLISNKISSGEKTINTLLVTCIIIINFSYYI